MQFGQVGEQVVLEKVDEDGERRATERLQACLREGPVAISPLIFGEVASAYEQIEVLEAVLARHLYAYWPIPREADFLAARAHAECRARGGRRGTTMPDFLVRAHAVIARCPLLTRDPQCYRQAFPGLRLITPESTPADPPPQPR